MLLETGSAMRVGHGRRAVYSCCMKWICRAAASLLVLAALSMVRVNAQQAPPAAAQNTQPTFEVAAIKPAKPGDQNHGWNGSTDQISIENYTLRRLIERAYGLKSESQVLGGPKWIDHEAFDIVAKIDDAEVAKIRSMSSKERQTERNLMLQSLLAERFQLKASRDEQTMPVYALVVERSGAKLRPSKPLATDRGWSLSVNNGHMTATAISMDAFADDLTFESDTGGRVVFNRTGLPGEYDFKMNWTEDNGNGVPPDAVYPSLFTALKEQLGLELKPEKALIPVVIVDSASEPVLD